MKPESILKRAVALGLSLIAGIGLPLTLLAAPSTQGLTMMNPKVLEVINVQSLVTPELMAQPEILGTAVGEDPDGEAVLVIYVNLEAKNQGEVMRALPATLHGKRVRAELTEPFRALGKPGSTTTKVSHTAKQTPPIKLGTSGGWISDLANGYCCGGTLGSLIQIEKGGVQLQYILSNYHVFESDIVPGGNKTVATTGDGIIQPGLIDVSCEKAKAQSVATLVKSSSLPNSNVDASIAAVTSGMVASDGSILEIGTISRTTREASLNLAVKKSGRTTGLSRSTVSGLNATVSVAYENECAGGAAFTKTFVGQIIVKNTRSKFLAGGDSGSLMVEDVATDPKAVGLLFAGSNTLAVANPIDDVLGFFNATMVGK